MIDHALSTLRLRWPRPREIALAVGLIAVAAVLRRWPLEGLGPQMPWLTFFPAAMLAALLGGFYPGLIATALSCTVVVFGWSWVASAPFIREGYVWIAVLFYGGSGFVFAAMAGALRHKRTLEEQARQDSEKVRVNAEGDRRFFLKIADAMPGLIAYWGRDLRCRFANHQYQSWYPHAPASLIGMGMVELLGAEVFALNRPHVAAVLRGTPQRFERLRKLADGSTQVMLADYLPDTQPDGSVPGFFVSVTDITQSKLADTNHKLMASVFNNTSEGIMVTDANGVILSVNPAFTTITGFSAEEAVGQTPRLLRSAQHEKAFHAEVWRTITQEGQWKGEIWNRRKDGSLFLMWQTITKVLSTSPDAGRYVSVFHDVTERYRQNERMQHAAFHDALTNLPNRQLLNERIGQQIAISAREQLNLAVLFLDLDGFKAVNDQHGHAVGDALLMALAPRLQALIRNSDTLARVGGDEFVAMLVNPHNLEQVAQVASRLVELAHATLELDGLSVQVSASVGIAIYPQDGASAEALLKNADTAMYAAKSAGKNGFRFYSATLPERVVDPAAQSSDASFS